MKRIVLSIFICLYISCTALFAQDKQTLKCTFPEGKYNIKVVTDMDLVVDMGGNKIPGKQHQTQYLTLEVDPVANDGTQKFVLELTRLDVKRNMMGMNMEFDSADKKSANSPMKDAALKVGVKISMYFDSNGKMVKTEGLEEFFDELVKKDPANKPFVEILKSQMSIDEFSILITTPKNAIPKNSVEEGEKWKSEEFYTVPSFGKTGGIEMENTYMGNKKVGENEFFGILSEGTGKDDKDNKVLVAPEAGFSLSNADIACENSFFINFVSGMPYSTKSNVKLAFELEADDQATGKQKFSAKIVSTVDYRVAK